MATFKQITKAYDDLCNHAKTGEQLERESVEVILKLLSEAANKAQV